MPRSGTDYAGQLYIIDSNTGNIVPAGSTGTVAGANTPNGPYIGTLPTPTTTGSTGTSPGSTGGPSPGARDVPAESYPNQPSTGGTGGTGGTTPTTAPPPATPQLDWKAYLADWGFPTDVTNELERIFKTYSDPSQAQAAALAYIRGTDWYSTTFSGIQAGIKNGVVSDEAGYRSYVNQLNQFYQRYYGRNVTTQEVSGYLNQGWNPNMVNQRFAGQAYVNANKPEIQYTTGAFGDTGQLTDQELAALGDQYGGLDNGLGPAVQKKVEVAKQRLQRIYEGVLATPSLSVLGSNGGLATSSGGGRTSDYGS